MISAGHSRNQHISRCNVNVVARLTFKQMDIIQRDAETITLHPDCLFVKSVTCFVGILEDLQKITPGSHAYVGYLDCPLTGEGVNNPISS